MLFWLLFIGVLLGAVAFFVSRAFDGTPFGYLNRRFRQMGWLGFALGLVAVVLLSMIANSIGTRWAKDNQLTYNEFLNGYEVEAVHLRAGCERDGSCRHTYDCDPYEVTVTKTRSVPDGKGGTRTETYTDTETEYHSCPYATEEWTFIIKTSLKKDFTIVESGFTDNPQPYRGHVGVPGGVHRGIPAFWAAARDRIASGNPGPVTITSTYKNYVLASQNTILKQFSGAVEDFKNQKMLPQISTATKDAGITAPYVGTKVYFVKDVPNKDAWRAAVNQFDSALGTNLQGDMHVVFVDHAVDKDRYKGALNAYWTGPELEKNGLSKNGIVLIIGTDGQKGVWMKAFTGMPGGNEAMITELESLKNINLSDPAAFLGQPKGVINGEKKVKEIVHTQGQIENIVWGPNKFQRVCMVCADANDKGTGFTYLDDQIEPTGGQVAVILIVSALLFTLIWGGLAWAQIQSPYIPINNPRPKGQKGT